jgi:hypothetical protein
MLRTEYAVSHIQTPHFILPVWWSDHLLYLDTWEKSFYTHCTVLFLPWCRTKPIVSNLSFNITAFFDITPCNWVDSYQYLGGTGCFHLQGMKGYLNKMNGDLSSLSFLAKRDLNLQMCIVFSPEDNCVRFKVLTAVNITIQDGLFKLWSFSICNNLLTV